MLSLPLRSPFIYHSTQVFVSVFLFLLNISSLYYQGDTVELSLIELKASAPDRFAKGQHVIALDSTLLADHAGYTFSDLLQRHTGLFVRQNGPGMLASLSMRGTSAGHNAFFWNGIPINSPSLGQADLSVLPVSAVDRLDIHLGSGGALYGTDALGGTVHLSSRLIFDKGWNASLQLGTGSFGMDRQEVHSAYSNKIFSTRTRVYRQMSRNEYPYTDLSQFGTPKMIQEHAAIRQMGVVQDFAWLPNEKTHVTSSFWWNSANREVQPTMGSSNRDQQADMSFRWVGDYRTSGAWADWNLKLGWVRDEMVFNVSDINITNQFLLSGELDWTKGAHLEAKSGVRLTQVVGNLSTYEARENRIELYQATNLVPFPSLHLSLNLRQQIYDGKLAPFTPAFGVDWTLIQSTVQQLTFKGSLSRSYKVPTLNDRFWLPGGNPNLSPETSRSSEGGLHYLYSGAPVHLEARITYFNMDVDDWIIWLPGERYWSPENVRKVNSEGMEIFVNIKKNLKTWTLGTSASWSYTDALIVSSVNNATEIGARLPYTPQHKGNFNTELVKGPFRSFANVQHVGSRLFSTDAQRVLEAYRLLDIGAGYTYKLAGYRLNLAFQLNNLLNKEYQVMRLRPMPGRNYQLNLTIAL